MTIQELAPLIGLVSLIVAILNFVHTRFQVQAALIRELGELNTRVKQFEHLEERFNKIEGEIRENKRIMDIIWGAIEDNMTRLLMHRNEPQRDTLLAKLRSRTLRYEEAIQLKAILDVDMQHEEQLSDLQVVALPWVMAAVNKAIATTLPDTPPQIPTTPSPVVPTNE